MANFGTINQVFSDNADNLRFGPNESIRKNAAGSGWETYLTGGGGATGYTGYTGYTGPTGYTGYTGPAGTGGATLVWDIDDLFSTFYNANSIATIEEPVFVSLKGTTDIGAALAFIFDDNGGVPYVNCGKLNFIGDSSNFDSAFGVFFSAIINQGAEFGHEPPNFFRNVVMLHGVNLGPFADNLNAPMSWHIGQDCGVLSIDLGGPVGRLIEIGDSSTNKCSISVNGALYNIGGAEPFRLTSPDSSLDVFIGDGSMLGEDLLAGKGTVDYRFYAPAEASMSHASFIGTLDIHHSNDSINLAYDPAISGLSNYNVQEAIDELASMFGVLSNENFYLKNQTIDGSVADGTGVAWNRENARWESPSAQSQIIGMKFDSIGSDTNCILLGGGITNNALSGVSVNRYWFNDVGGLTTTETRAFAGYKLPNNLFIFKPLIEYGRQGPFKRETVAPMTLGWVSMIGSLDEVFEQNAVNVTSQDTSLTANVGDGTIIAAMVGDNTAMNIPSGNHVMLYDLSSYSKPVPARYGFVGFNRVWQNTYLNTFLEGIGGETGALILGATDAVEHSLLSFIRDLGTESPSMYGISSGVTSSLGSAISRDHFHPKASTFTDTISSGAPGWIYVSGDYEQMSLRHIVDWSSFSPGDQWELTVSCYGTNFFGIGPFDENSLASEIETAINNAIASPLPGFHQGYVSVSGDYSSGFKVVAENFYLSQLILGGSYNTAQVKWLKGGFVAELSHNPVTKHIRVTQIYVMGLPNKGANQMSGFRGIYLDTVNRLYVPYSINTSSGHSGAPGIIVLERNVITNLYEYSTDIVMDGHDTDLLVSPLLTAHRWGLSPSSTVDMPVLALAFNKNYGAGCIAPFNWNQSLGTIAPVIEQGGQNYFFKTDDANIAETSKISMGFGDRHSIGSLGTFRPMLSVVFQKNGSAKVYTVRFQHFIGDYDNWNALTVYDDEMLVKYLGVVYECVSPSTGDQPDISPSFWQAIGSVEPMSPTEFIVTGNDTSSPTITNIPTKGVICNEFNNTVHVGLNCVKLSRVITGLIRISDYKDVPHIAYDTNAFRPESSDELVKVEPGEDPMSLATFSPVYNVYAPFVVNPSYCFNIESRSAWASGSAYFLSDTVGWRGRFYICVNDYGGVGTFEEPGVGTDWSDEGPSGYEYTNETTWVFFPPSEWQPGSSYQNNICMVRPTVGLMTPRFYQGFSATGSGYDLITGMIEPDWSLHVNIGDTFAEENIDLWDISAIYNTGDRVRHDAGFGEMVFVSAQDSQQGNTPAHIWIAGHTLYILGDKVSWNGTLYECAQAGTTDEPGTSGHWTSLGSTWWDFMGEPVTWRCIKQNPPTHVDTSSHWDNMQYSSEIGTIAISQDPSDAGTYFVSLTDPTNNNDGVDTAGLGFKFEKGYFWLNEISQSLFLCVNNSTGAATWALIKENVFLRYTRAFDITGNVPAGTEFNIVTGVFGNGETSSLVAPIPVASLPGTMAEFNDERTLHFFINGNRFIKGVNVHWVNATTVTFDVDLDTVDNIEIERISA